jgi:cytochrome d ubiquinol oxidase subunit II
MELTTVWFVLIAVLWIGYLVLEGFDFGVGMLLPVLGRDEPTRRAMLRTIGPVWDGNEVWLVVAGGATFAAFPEWYATLFSGFYIPLFVILLCLIVRGIGIEYREKRHDAAWLRWCDLGILVGSTGPAVLWGVALTNVVWGVPIDADGEFVGGFWSLLQPHALLGGLVTLGLFLTHGASFLALKTRGDVHHRAHRLVPLFGLPTAVLAVAYLAWLYTHAGTPVSLACSVAAAAALLAGLSADRLGRDGWAFTGTAFAIGLAALSLFVTLFPDVMPSTLDPDWSLTTENAASTPYTLQIMTVVAAIFTPVVLAYESWSYWVFRRRISVDDLELVPAE